MYSVNLYGSHPDKGNDDCHSGADFGTKEEALACFNDLSLGFSEECLRRTLSCTAFIEVDGPDINKVRANPSFRPSRDDDEWRRELAMQHGMTFGCNAYNEWL